MNDRKKAELAMLLGVHEFGQRNPLVPANALATLHYAAVATAKDTMLETGAVKDQAEGECQRFARKLLFHSCPLGLSVGNQ